MEQDWQDLKEPWERVIWARKKWFMKTTGSTGSKEAAAESLGMKRSTYAAYERSPDSSRTAKLDQEHAIHFGKKFGVNWVWLLTNQGSPFGEDVPEPILRITNALKVASPEQQEAAADIIEKLFSKKAS